MSDELKAFVKARDEMLLKGSIDDLRAFMQAYDMPFPEDDKSAELTLHKTITAAVDLPMEYRRKSKQWLLERGCMPLDDGDV